MKPLIAIGILVGIVTEVAKIYACCKHFQLEIIGLKQESSKWQSLYYDKLTTDDIAWG